MARPTVLVATTNPAMAYALQVSLKDKCKSLGLKLEVCPDGDEHDVDDKKARAYDSAEALFDALERGDPMELADTLVVLDVGAGLGNAFEPKASTDSWHVTQNRAGVAVELILRFPQVFPVFLSPAVPMPDSGKWNGTGVISPKDGKTISKKDLEVGNWGQFGALRELLGTRHKLNGKPTDVDCINQLFALQIPLHFVSPLDQGQGLESSLERFASGMRCWFDPTGLRTLVRNYFLGTLFGSKADWSNTWKEPNHKKPVLREVLLERLDHVAVAVDEEREFAMLNAYAAYKFGRRAWIVTTFAGFNDKPLWVKQTGADTFDTVVLRDIDIRFPDIPEANALREKLKTINSSLWDSYDQDGTPQQRLGGKEKWRVRVVSSSQKIGEGKLWCCAEEWRLGERESGCDSRYIGLSKPISTLYELKKLLSKHRFCFRDVISVISRISPVNEKSMGGHGAPYLNLPMAESLLLQARRCSKNSMENLIGALLAGEAQELLLGMSRTTALEALLLQHKHEVMAEVEFPGVSHAIDIRHRQNDVEAVLKQFTNGSISTIRMKNMFLSQFWDELKLTYRNGEQFSAAEAANARSLVHSKWLPSLLPSWFVLFGWIDKFVLLIKSIVAKIATSFTWWLLASLFVVVYARLGYLFASASQCTNDVPKQNNIFFYFDDVFLSSITMQPMGWVANIAQYCEWRGTLAAIFHLGFAYILFGVLISMLYRKITRS